MTPPDLVARGRSADVFDAGPGRVVRRLRSGTVRQREVEAMETARASGYPVPEVFRVEGPEIEMERVDGPDLLSELGRRPWRVRWVADTLADLHLRLRDVTVDDGEALVHGDLHPGNVIHTASGPVVIDWENASTGPCDADAAIVWLLLTVADADDVALPLRPVVPVIRRILLRRFLTRVGRPRPETVVMVCDDRLDDRNMRAGERDRIRRFRSRHGGVGAEVRTRTSSR